MRKALFVLAALISLAVAGMAAAHEHEGKDEAHDSLQTITGEVVDLACYLSAGEMGPNHRECAQKCITSGLPVGIKSGDQVYLAMTSEHGPANTLLASLAAQQVTVEGTVTERDGVHLIAIKKITLKE